MPRDAGVAVAQESWYVELIAIAVSGVTGSPTTHLAGVGLGVRGESGGLPPSSLIPVVSAAAKAAFIDMGVCGVVVVVE